MGAVGRILVDPCVAVAVGNVEVAVAGVNGHVGAAVEGVATHEAGRLAADAQGEQHRAVQIALADGVVAVVGAEDGIVGTHGYAVGPGVSALAPGPEEVAVLVEDDHGVLAPVEGIDVVVGVHAHCGYFFESPAVGQLAPALGYFIGIFARTQFHHSKNLVSVDCRKSDPGPDRGNCNTKRGS